ncbi:MAG: threonine-phosphate decarboxylase [Gloeocapsa sp. DLM2.Bin57]|nr:MAG: threonine-phosphate decarboxylase [Gloeocapsa sp. DLM2.Bin57]
MRRPNHGGNLNWASNIANCPPSLILDFSASINPLGPPLSVLRAIASDLDSIKAYPDPNYPELKQVLAQWHQIPSEYILPGNGSAELLTWAAWELSQLTSTYVLTPAFGDYWRALTTFGVKINTCPLDLVTENWTINTISPQSEGLIITNPHNPTGKLFSRETLLPYLDNFGLVVVDEAFMDFLPPSQSQTLIDWVQDYPNLVILRSLTKFYSLAGLRIGYAIANPERIQRWQQWRDPWTVNSLAITATIAALKDTLFQQQTWNWLTTSRQQLFTAIASLPQFQPLGSLANFLLVKTSLPGSQLQQKLLLQDKIFIRDCLSFPELGEDYFRVAILSPESNNRLVTALSQCQ